MKEEYFWSIVIEQDLVQAGIWTIRDEKVAIISTSGALKWETDEDLVEKADSCLSEAVNNFPEDAKEPSKAVFGVPASWVEEGKIKKPHLDKIRLVSQKLSLSPTGFVVLPEAIAHSVKVKEGSPLSGVVLGVGVGSLDLTVFRLGNIVGTVNVGRSTSVVEDIVEGLSRFASGQNMPTRWLLYDGTEVDLEDVKQELLSADWKDTGSIKFLHTPQIEVVSVDEKAEAISIAGASEMGEIKGVEGFETKSEPAESNISETSDLKPEDLGFVIDQDISDNKPPEYASSEITEESQLEAPSQSSKLAPIWGFIKKMKFKPNLPKMKHNQGQSPMIGSKKNKLKYALFVAPVVIVVAFIAAWLYLPKAEITIFISPKNLQESETVILDAGVSFPDIDNLTFPARSIEAEVSSEKSVNTTGTKTVGERARGSITIRNGTAAEEEFDAGARVTSSGGLEYTLDEGVTVPEAESPTTPGTVTVNATASEFGEDYNLAADESLSVENYPKSEIDAVVSEQFSGGSSEEIQAVASSDRERLQDELTSELELKAVSELESQAFGARFVRDAVRFEVIDESFSGAVGDEATSVSLTMTMKATGILLPEEQIKELSELILKDQVPEGFTLRSEQVKAEFDLVDEIGDNAWEFDVSLSANLLPSVDIDTIKAEISGKQPEAVRDYLSRIPGFVRSTVTVWPKFPAFFGNIPRMVKNISVEVASE